MPKNSLGASPYYDDMSKGNVNHSGEVTPKGRGGYGTDSPDIPYADPRGHTVDPDTQKRLKKSMMDADASRNDGHTTSGLDSAMQAHADKIHPAGN